MAGNPALVNEDRGLPVSPVPSKLNGRYKHFPTTVLAIQSFFVFLCKLPSSLRPANFFTPVRPSKKSLSESFPPVRPAEKFPSGRPNFFRPSDGRRTDIQRPPDGHRTAVRPSDGCPTAVRRPSDGAGLDNQF